MGEKPFFRLNLGITKCYLLECTGGYLLVDTGYTTDYAKFLKALHRASADGGVDLHQIKYLLLTHHHDDHAGFAAELVQETGARVIVHRDAVAPLERGESEPDIEPVNWQIFLIFGLFALVHGEFKFPPLVLTERDVVVDGDDANLLRGIGVDGEIVHTPGHTQDSISVVMSDGSVFCGDAAMNFLQFAGVRHRPIYQVDRAAVFRSWRRLLDRGARMIYPAHGDPFKAERLARYLERFADTADCSNPEEKTWTS